MDHLLLHCLICLQVVSFVFSAFGAHWVMPEKELDVYAGKGFMAGILFFIKKKKVKASILKVRFGM